MYVLGGEMREEGIKGREECNVLASKGSSGPFTTLLVSLKMLFASRCLNS